MRKLRRKIVVAVLASATAVFLLTIMLTWGLLAASNSQRADRVTEFISENSGRLPEKKQYDRMNQEQKIDFFTYDEESPYRIRYFAVKFSDGSPTDIDVSHIAAVDGSDAVDMAESVMNKHKSVGYYKDYRYRVSEENGYVIFLDISADNEAIFLLVMAMSAVAVVFIVLITIVFHFVSKRVVRPFEENSRMQKQFITDASHELKTPLAIISANAEVLAYKDGENEWIKNITAQTERISGLINELLTLNRLEEIDTNIRVEPLNLSEIVNSTLADFDEVFSAKSVTVENNITPDVTLNGNSDQLKRLSSVLIENASKYVSEGGVLRIGLKKEARYTRLTVFNSCETDPDADYKHLFDRFYRPDSSRTSKTGGHGIGLSIAKRIVTLHNGSIEAVPNDEGLSFNVKISNKLKPNAKEKG